VKTEFSILKILNYQWNVANAVASLCIVKIRTNQTTAYVLPASWGENGPKGLSRYFQFI
jgi:hypothetical protein